MTPPTLEKYELVEQLGAGGMATLFRAVRRADGLPCAIKVLHSTLAKDPSVNARFLREAQVAAELNHPHIASLLDARAENGVFFLAMELIAGRDLEATMEALAERGTPPPVPLAVYVATCVLDALHHAHEHCDSEGRHLAIVHRDVNPKNIMLGYDGSVKLIDFGVARANIGGYQTAPGMVVGTLRYMSPEQATADEVDRRSDLYALCAVLYELLAGSPVIVASGQMDILRQVVLQPVDTRPLFRAGVPELLIRALAHGLAKRPDDRPTSAQALKDEILAAIPRTRAGPKNIVHLLATAFGTTDPEVQSTDYDDVGPTVHTTRLEAGLEPSKPHRRSRWWAGGAAFALALAIFAIGRSRSPSEVVQVPIAPEPALPRVDPRRPTARPLRAVPTQPARGRAETTRTDVAVSAKNRSTTPRTRAPRGRPDPLARLRRDLDAIEAGTAPLGNLLEVSEQIRRLASNVEDAEVRNRLRRRVRASAMLGDVEDVREMLDLLASSSQRAPRSPR